MEALARLNETLFENSDKIPEGLYLELMNLTKDIFTKNQNESFKTIKCDINKYRIRNVRHNTGGIYLTNENEFNITGRLVVGDLIELLAMGEDRLFLEIEKINKCSVIFKQIIFRKGEYDTNYSYQWRHLILKIAEKTDQNDIGLWYNNLLPKKITFYDLKQTELKNRFQYLKSLLPVDI